MKKIFTLFAFFAFAAVFAQHKVADKVAEFQAQHAAFTHFSVLSPSTQPADGDVSRAVTKSTLAQINMTSVNDIVAHQYETIEVEVPYLGNVILVELYKVNPFNENFHLDTNKQKNIAYQRGVYYRGIINGDTNSVASMNFFNNEMNGIVSATGINNLVIGKLDKPNNVNDYIVYSDADMRVPSGFNCSFKADDAPVQQHDASREIQTEHCVTMYMEIDYDLFTQNNSSTTETNNWVTSVFNNLQTLYNNDNITVSLKSVYIWTDQDPYEGVGDDSGAYLGAFNQQRPVFDGDVGQLIGIDPGGLGGVAVAINGLCSQNNFSYADVNFSFSTVPTYSWTVEVTTHEFGHLLGSRHTHACVWNGNNTSIDGCGTQAGYAEGNCALGPIPTAAKGTIMSYCHLIQGVGISFNNGFGTQPAEAITTAVENATCLSSDCITTCINTVVDIATTFPTNNSATITWNDLGNATSWQISVTTFSSAFENWVTVNTNSYTTPATLNINAYYKVHIRPVCDNATPGIRQGIFATPAVWCNGVTITDSGGANGAYTDNQYYVRTIIPNVPQKKIHLVFSAFSLEQDYDYLNIYNGPTTSSDEIGSYTGTTITTPIDSSSPDGSLTLEFISDAGVTDTGYVATVSCTTNLGNDQFTRDVDFTYSPNPTNGMVSIVSNTEMSDIKIYNIQGQLLYKSANNGLQKAVDISAFATGTYFFKLKFGDKEANFKIVKK